MYSNDVFPWAPYEELDDSHQEAHLVVDDEDVRLLGGGARAAWRWGGGLEVGGARGGFPSRGACLRRGPGGGCGPARRGHRHLPGGNRSARASGSWRSSWPGLVGGDVVRDRGRALPAGPPLAIGPAFNGEEGYCRFRCRGVTSSARVGRIETMPRGPGRSATRRRSSFATRAGFATRTWRGSPPTSPPEPAGPSALRSFKPGRTEGPSRPGSSSPPSSSPTCPRTRSAWPISCARCGAGGRGV